MLDSSQRRVFLIVLLLVGMLLLPVILNPTPRSESANENHPNIRNDNHQNLNPVAVFFSYLESTIVVHEKLFIVLSTFAIAGFTGTLYWVTKGLLGAAARQQSDMRESMRIATIACRCRTTSG